MAVKQQPSAVELGLFFLLFFAVWSLRATYLYWIDESFVSANHRTVYSTVVKVALWAVPAFGFVYWRRGVSPCKYLGLTVVPPLRQWAVYLGVVGVFLGAVTAFALLVEGKVLTPTGLSFHLTISGLLTILVSPLVEEILFRGLFLKECSCLLPGWIANLLTSVLFVGIHLPFWLSHGGFNAGVGAHMVGVFCVSLVSGWLYLKSFSLWPSWILHVANNLLVGQLVVSHR